MFSVWLVGQKALHRKKTRNGNNYAILGRRRRLEKGKQGWTVWETEWKVGSNGAWIIRTPSSSKAGKNLRNGKQKDGAEESESYGKLKPGTEEVNEKESSKKKKTFTKSLGVCICCFMQMAWKKLMRKIALERLANSGPENQLSTEASLRVATFQMKQPDPWLWASPVKLQINSTLQSCTFKGDGISH